MSTEKQSKSAFPVIEVQLREATGSSVNRRFRREGRIPAVVYHRGEASISGTLDEREFSRVAAQSRISQVFALKSGDSRLDGRSALVKEVQRDYIKGKVLHVDLQALKDDEEITVDVALKVIGEAVGVKSEGGILTIATHAISVSCFPKQIPSEITIDISELHLGESIHAAALKLPPGVRLRDNPEETIVSVVAVRQVEEAPAVAVDAAAAGAVPADGAAAPGTPGAAAAGEAGAADKGGAKGDKSDKGAPKKDAGKK